MSKADRSVAARIVSVALFALGWLVAGVRLVLDLIGYATAPDDARVATGLLHRFLVWILDLPWAVPWGFAFVVTLWIMRVSWPRHLAPENKNDPSLGSAAKQVGFVQLLETKHKIRDTDILYEADLQFLKDGRNVAVAVEVSIAEMSFAGWKWKRLRRVEVARSDRNRGDSERILLVELRLRKAPENAIEQLVRPKKKSILEGQQARLNVRVTATASGQIPYVEERLFLWKGNEVFPMPLSVPATELGDSIDFEEGPCVLWFPTS